MTEPALSMLLERLLWPVPRIRWEVCRSLARLIRKGNENVAKSLLDWISTRQLESEVVLGLCIIEAFELGEFFEFEEVLIAVQAPSHLSDWLLINNFNDAHGLSTLRYAVSNSEPATLEREVDSWFEKYRKWAVPEIFSVVLQSLDESTGFRFLDRWQHEWRWLQATHARPSADYPYYFSGGDRGHRGQFDHGQRELYVSAYLRTLAYAALVGAISHTDAEEFSLLCLTMNRGLAGLQPVQRPGWVRNLQSRDPANKQEIARELWGSAFAASNSDEIPIYFRALDTNSSGFIEYELNMSLVPCGYTKSTLELDQLHNLPVNESPGRLTGAVGRSEGVNPRNIVRPLALSQIIELDFVGRAHIEMVMNVRLASPSIFGTLANLRCNQNEIRLETNNGVFSRWIHWYTNWEPTTFPELKSTVGSITTVSKASLDRLQLLKGMEIKPIAKVRRATRSMPHRDYKVDTEVFWV